MPNYVRCISFDSYIKPQLNSLILIHSHVVYLLIPTSNHNHCFLILFFKRVVYLLIPTSNHNAEVKNTIFVEVVYLLIPTSNHNWGVGGGFGVWLYIFWFLHQTTTHTLFWLYWIGCISFDSYIKPQLRAGSRTWCAVVYLLIPTSNHNYLFNERNRQLVVYLLIPTSNHNMTSEDKKTCQLYIFWFLHQTTTYNI